MPRRTEWIDYAKGIGIILVVYGHLLSSDYHAGVAIPKQFFLLSDSLVYSFHVPLFFFLAGLFTRRSLSRRSVGQFITDKAKLLLYPYLVWSFLQSLAELLFAGHSYRGVGLHDLLAIPYLPHAQFWFLYALFWMYLAFVLFSLPVREGAAIVLVLLGAGLLFFDPIATEVMGLRGFSTGFLFFAVGVLAENLVKDLEKLLVPMWASVLGLVVFLGAGLYIFEHRIAPVRLTDGSHPIYFLFLAWLGILFSVGFSQLLARRHWLRMILLLGRYSLPIYLAHMLAGVAARVILWNVFRVRSPLLHMIVGMGTGLSAPVITYKIAQKMHFSWLFELKSPGTAIHSPRHHHTGPPAAPHVA